MNSHDILSCFQLAFLNSLASDEEEVAVEPLKEVISLKTLALKAFIKCVATAKPVTAFNSLAEHSIELLVCLCILVNIVEFKSRNLGFLSERLHLSASWEPLGGFPEHPQVGPEIRGSGEPPSCSHEAEGLDLSHN